MGTNRWLLCTFLFFVLVINVNSRRTSSGGGRRTGSRPSYSRTYHPASKPSPSVHVPKIVPNKAHLDLTYSPSHGRPGGGSRPSYPSYPSPSRPSYPSHPSPARPSYPSHPSPARPSYPSHPSPAPSHPAPSQPSAPSRPSYPSYPHPSPPAKAPSSNPSHPSNPSAPSAPHPDAKGPVGPPIHTNIQPDKHKTVNNQAPPPYPGGAAYPGHPQQQYPHQQYPPAYPGQPLPQSPPHGAPPAYYPPPPSYQGGSFHPPPYPGQHYGGGAGGVTIINNNNHNNHHYGGGGGGYFGPPSYPSYHYGSSDTGSGTVGFFLGYSLAKLTTPTYHSYTTRFYDGYSPRYDHYEVHHYYHGNNERIIERERVIESNKIVGCAGDSGSICPANTTSLCTSEGTIMCVASATTTVPCIKEKDTNCIKSTIPCIDPKTPGCEGKDKSESTVVSIPCISNAKINGELTYVNNTIVGEVKNTTLDANSTTTTTTGSPISSTTTLDGMTTTPNSTINGTIVKREAPQQNFCVTILALPATRKQTEGEEIYDQVENVANKFFEKAFGV